MMAGVEAHATEEGGSALVNVELSSHSTSVSTTTTTTAAAADVMSEAPAESADASSGCASVKQLKLRLFQQLSRRHRHAWSQYWRALQQYLMTRLSLDEFQCIVAILLGPDLGT